MSRIFCKPGLRQWLRRPAAPAQILPSDRRFAVQVKDVRSIHDSISMSHQPKEGQKEQQGRGEDEQDHTASSVNTIVETSVNGR